LSVIQNMLREGVTPVIPSQGSVGASGDLAPLAHMAAAMIGEGEAIFGGERMPAAEALGQGRHRTRRACAQGRPRPDQRHAILHRLCAGRLFRRHPQSRGSVVSSCLSTDAIMGSTAPLEEGIHAFRGHRGQIDVAAPCAP
jgi:histidine ammonia-lyase